MVDSSIFVIVVLFPFSKPLFETPCAFNCPESAILRDDQGEQTMSRRKLRSGGGATNRSNDVSLDAPEPELRTRSLPLPAVQEELGSHGTPANLARRPANDHYKVSARGLGESFQESQTHNSWRGFPKRGSAKSSKSG
jgi:hypothetical protein